MSEHDEFIKQIEKNQNFTNTQHIGAGQYMIIPSPPRQHRSGSGEVIYAELLDMECKTQISGTLGHILKRFAENQHIIINYKQMLIKYIDHCENSNTQHKSPAKILEIEHLKPL